MSAGDLTDHDLDSTFQILDALGGLDVLPSH